MFSGRVLAADRLGGAQGTRRREPRQNQMSSSSQHRVTSSSHKLYHEAFKWAKLYVNIGVVYGILLLAGAFDVLTATPLVFMMGLPQYSHDAAGAAQTRMRRAGALSLATSGVMALLVSLMVRRCCKMDRSKTSVSVNWHDLFKYTHMGRAITAAMTAVLTSRGLGSLNDFRPEGGGIGRVPTLIVLAAVLSMLTAGSMHFLHFRMKAAYMEYARIKRSAAPKKNS